MGRGFIAFGLLGCSAVAQPGGLGDRVPAPSVDADGCVELACRACASGEQCADAPDVPDTCCANGDALLHLAAGAGSEVVDAITDGDYAVMCGGFGAAVSDVRDPSAPAVAGSATRRCQNATFGPVLPDGSRIFYTAHHGDSWIPTPSLQAFAIDARGAVVSVDALEDPEILFEGLAYHEGFLYVAAHGLGVLVYRVEGDGGFARVGEIEGFDNAVEVAAQGSTLYVADRVSGIHVLSLVDPEAPPTVQIAATNGNPRDVAAGDGRLFVALGSAGIDVFDVAADGRLAAAARIPTSGAVQQVDADSGIVAAAAWSHVAVYDSASLRLLATERTRATPEFEQDLGVAVAGDLVVAGEWEDMHLLRFRRGYVAPDIFVEQELLEFDGAQADTRAVVVRNRGALPLEISQVRSNASSFSAEAMAMSVPAGGAASFEVTHTPPGPETGLIEIFSNDPDDDQTPFAVWVDATQSDRLGVGDTLPAEFGFLDIAGTGDVANLQGKVIVLAYFALF